MHPKTDHFNGRVFHDLTHPMKHSFGGLLKWVLNRKPNPWPKQVPNKHFDKPPSTVEGTALRVSNIGHVTFLIQSQGVNILTDPVWSQRASPFSCVGPKRIIQPGIRFEDLPPIDVVLISHNHYDHMDMATIDALWKKYKPRIIVPLKNERIIQAYNKNIKVEAYDWGEHTPITPALTIHLDPMQHWSARSPFDRNKALWAAFTIRTDAGNIYFAGDTGYGDGRYFKAAKQKYGHFRLALLPMGAYEPRWFMGYPHMNPQDMLKAHIDLGRPYTIPSHYDVFPLADDGYGEALAALSVAQQALSITDNIEILEVGGHRMVP